jgi:hypothetical protein
MYVEEDAVPKDTKKAKKSKRSRGARKAKDRSRKAESRMRGSRRSRSLLDDDSVDEADSDDDVSGAGMMQNCRDGDVQAAMRTLNWLRWEAGQHKLLCSNRATGVAENFAEIMCQQCAPPRCQQMPAVSLPPARRLHWPLMTHASRAVMHCPGSLPVAHLLLPTLSPPVVGRYATCLGCISFCRMFMCRWCCRGKLMTDPADVKDNCRLSDFGDSCQQIVTTTDGELVDIKGDLDAEDKSKLESGNHKEAGVGYVMCGGKAYWTYILG